MESVWTALDALKFGFRFIQERMLLRHNDLFSRMACNHERWWGSDTSPVDTTAAFFESFLADLFEHLEPGSAIHLRRFLEEGKYKYQTGMHDLVYRPGLSITELIDPALIKGVFRLHVFQSISQYIRKFFKNPRIIQLLEFPVLFLGATPEKTPALYSLMNYADMALGTWYPMGGMYKIVEAMVSLAEAQGVNFRFNSAVQHLDVHSGKIDGIITTGGHLHTTDYVVASADYHHVEQQLLPERYRRYSRRYWDSRVMAPSSVLFFLGLNKRVEKLAHHTLFFDQDFSHHARQIYDDPQWPDAPLFYVSCTSKTDPSVAPPGGENLFILIPVAPGLDDSTAQREACFDRVIQRLENILGESIKPHIVCKRTYAHNDFITDYNAFRGNAYGLANTLWQTANLKPGIVNKKVKNLFYTGQLTVPGPGVPPSLISGQVVASELIRRNRSL
jgi:phytoene desaturase